MIQPELKAYRRCSDRHVLVLETNLTYVEKCQIFHYADLIRKAGNELTGIMKKRYDQLNVIKLRDDEPSRYYCLDGIFI